LCSSSVVDFAQRAVVLRTLSTGTDESVPIHVVRALLWIAVINERERAADKDPDFSRFIREGLPRSD
jgi:hypothetical protein